MEAKINTASTPAINFDTITHYNNLLYLLASVTQFPSQPPQQQTGVSEFVEYKAFATTFAANNRCRKREGVSVSC